MRWKSPFLFCDSEAARFLTLQDQRTAVWLHMERAPSAELKSLVLGLAIVGTVHFAVSGVEASYIHDEIDDALMDVGITNIATTWHDESLDEVAWDFANVDFVSGGISLRCVIVVGDSTEGELSKLAELVTYVFSALGEEGPEGKIKGVS